MDVVLIGSDFEENLGLGMLAAVARDRGHSVCVEPFNTSDRMAALARRIADRQPDVVGLSMQFQHRAHEFLSLARALRSCGYAGHVTCGGQFPSLAFREVLRQGAVDTVVLHDGELTFGELLDALSAHRSVSDVAGLAFRSSANSLDRTANRPLTENLDALPFPFRYRTHSEHCGIPFIPIMGSRGCWGKCTYCAITTGYRDARAHGGGKALRLRSPANVADEMATLVKRSRGRHRGRTASRSTPGPCVFCFHDDNLLLPKASDTLERLQEIRRQLDARGVGPVGIVGKCRPETIDAPLAKELRKLGVIRLYVGVENASPRGAAHLGRGQQHLAIGTALDACRESGIFACYNVLLFEPQATLDDVEQNISFIRAHADHPVNFCRAEPYYGTPLHDELDRRGTLRGSYLGYDYRIDDDRTELLFRICASAFRERNFRPDGVANRTMGLGYQAKLIEAFYADSEGEIRRLSRRAGELLRRITLDTAASLDSALEFARTVSLSDFDSIERRTALLGLEVAASDAVWLRELDEIGAAFDVASARARKRLGAGRAVARLARGVAVGASLALGAAAAACGGETNVDPVPPDAGVDADRGLDGSGDSVAFDHFTPEAGQDVNVADVLPPDAGRDASFMEAGRDGMVVDPLVPDAGRDVNVADALPPDAGRDASFMEAGRDGMVVDPLVPDAGRDVNVADVLPPDAGRDAASPDTGIDAAVVDPPPPDAGRDTSLDARMDGVRSPLPLIDHWRDTTPKRTVRSDDLPLYDPPEVRIAARREGMVVVATLQGGPEAIGTRWQADGTIDGEGLEVRWTPAGDTDSLRVAVRTRGGVAVVSVRAPSVTT